MDFSTFECLLCPGGASVEDRENCSECGVKMKIMKTVFFPCTVTNGSYRKGHASCGINFGLMILLLKAGDYKFVANYMPNKPLSDKLSAIFGGIEIRFVGSRTPEVYEIVESIFYNMLDFYIKKDALATGAEARQMLKYSDVDFSEDTVFEGEWCRFAYIDNLHEYSRREIVEKMSYAGTQVAWGISNTEEDSSYEFFHDNDEVFRERPFHFRIMHTFSKYVIFMVVATANYFPMERSLGDSSASRGLEVTTGGEVDVLESGYSVLEVTMKEREKEKEKMKPVSNTASYLASFERGEDGSDGSSDFPENIATSDDDGFFDNGTAAGIGSGIGSGSRRFSVARGVKLIYTPGCGNEVSSLDRALRQRFKYLDMSSYSDNGQDSTSLYDGCLYYTDDAIFVQYVVRQIPGTFDYLGCYYLKDSYSMSNLDKGYASISFRSNNKKMRAICNLIQPMLNKGLVRIGSDNDHSDNGRCYKKLFSNWVDSDDDPQYFDDTVVGAVDSGIVSLNHNRGKGYDLKKVNDCMYHVDYGNRFNAMQVYGLCVYIHKRGAYNVKNLTVLVGGILTDGVYWPGIVREFNFYCYARLFRERKRAEIVRKYMAVETIPKIMEMANVYPISDDEKTVLIFESPDCRLLFFHIEDKIIYNQFDLDMSQFAHLEGFTVTVLVSGASAVLHAFNFIHHVTMCYDSSCACYFHGFLDTSVSPASNFERFCRASRSFSFRVC
jgi:hypothetical protein